MSFACTSQHHKLWSDPLIPLLSPCRAIAKYCPKLESACLRMMPKLDDDAVIAVVKQCKSLQTLSLAWTQLTATGLSALAEYGKELRHLDVSGSREDLTDEGVEQLTLLCTKLLTLDLSDCYALTDASINHIVLNSPCISHVSLSRCHNITVAGMRFVGGGGSCCIEMHLPDHSNHALTRALPTLAHFPAGRLRPRTRCRASTCLGAIQSSSRISRRCVRTSLSTSACCLMSRHAWTTTPNGGGKGGRD